MPTALRRPRIVVPAILLVVVIVATAVLGGLTVRWFVKPAVTTDRPQPADAVVMLGGSGPRFAEAVRLAEGGTAPWLVLSDPRDARQVWTAFGAFCQEEHPYRTVCFDPQPDTTRGEARYVAELARREGWQRVVVVATTEQAMRAARLLERCWDGEVQVADVSSGRSRPLRIAYEWAATLRAALTRRGC